MKNPLTSRITDRLCTLLRRCELILTGESEEYDYQVEDLVKKVKLAQRYLMARQLIPSDKLVEILGDTDAEEEEVADLCAEVVRQELGYDLRPLDAEVRRDYQNRYPRIFKKGS